MPVRLSPGAMRSIFLLILLTSFNAAIARQITGRILDRESKKPVRYATVIIFGTTNGTVANHLGFFNLEVSDTSILVISSIGYETSRVDVPASNQFVISLERQYVRIEDFDLTYFKKRNEVATLTQVQSFSAAEQDAIYPGGGVALYNNLGEALLKNDKALLVDSAVTVRFTVDINGKIGDVDLGEISENNAVPLISIFQSLQVWKPAMQHGNPVEQRFIVSLRKSSESPEEIYTVVEDPAQPPEGWPKFYQFVGEIIEYPKAAKSAGIQGKVFVEFTVNTDGSLSDITIVQGIGGGCDGEAMRVIALSPNWIPGKQRGKAVRQKMVMPITFSLSSGQRTVKSNAIEPTDISRNFYGWMSAVTKYPADARRIALEGAVIVELKIDLMTGIIQDVKVLQDIGAGCGAEVKRVLSSVTKEAILNLQPDRDRLILPVVFGLERKFTEFSTVRYQSDETMLLKPVNIVAVGVTRERKAIGYVPSGSTPKTKIAATSFTDYEKNETSMSLSGLGIDEIPPTISQFNKLKFLDLERNVILSIPTEFGALENLEEFYIPENKVSSLPKSFGNLMSLKILGLANNKFTQFPIEITELLNLKALDIAGYQIKEIPTEIEKLVNLSELYLQDNQIDHLPESIFKLVKLKKLYLDGNPIKQAEIDKIKQRLPKTEIEF